MAHVGRATGIDAIAGLLAFFVLSADATRSTSALFG
jgi:hypothetical protein